MTRAEEGRRENLARRAGNAALDAWVAGTSGGLLVLTLPWHCLASDNLNKAPLGREAREKGKRYKQSKLDVASIASAQYAGAVLTCDLIVTGIAYPPDKRRRDIGNFRKGLLDALQGVVYADDYQIVRETWCRGSIDKANPRLELLLERANA